MLEKKSYVWICHPLIAKAIWIAVASLVSLPASHARAQTSDLYIITEAESLAEGVKYTEGFGVFNDTQFPWVYHYSMGWLYLTEGELDDFWIFSVSMNTWLWSSKERFPAAYDAANQKWYYLYFEGEIAWYYDFESDTWHLIEGVPSRNSSDAMDEHFESLASTSRFLSMAGFGAGYDEIVSVHEQGIHNWLNEQLAMEHRSIYDQMVETYPELEGAVSRVDMKVFHEILMKAMLTSEDSLRNKVTLALSEIFVVSSQNAALRDPRRLFRYYDTLSENAFGSFEELLYSVTLSPVMGHYLSHAGNQAADPEIGRFPDENYAREVMQLFSIGLHRLNIDGSPILDENGQTIPTYTNQDITELARVFTGLFYDHSQNDALNNLTYRRLVKRGNRNFNLPLVMYEEGHDSGEKSLVNGGVIEAGTPGLEAVRQAINHLATHPNTAPFISRLLIQRLVTSNPSPAYIERVARVFQNNGRGAYGDLAAVIAAILTDDEAISPVNGRSGRMRSPYYRVIHMLRAFNAMDGSARYNFEGTGRLAGLNQQPFQSPTVFNFYQSDFQPIGAIADQGMVAPEFQITDSRTMVKYMNEIDHILFYMRNRYEKFNSPGFVPSERIENPNRFEGKRSEPYKLDLTDLETLSENPRNLVNRLNLVLVHGQLSRNTQNSIIRALESLPNRDSTFRVSFAIYLTMISPDYIVMQ
ncbi:MAG: DUF1800 domain-containing protein [Verrucomicrobiota bacterium]